jgi:predicted Na+-dependent transporter
MTPGAPTPRAAHLPIDGFILALACVVLAATVLPCRGGSADVVHIAGIFAIAALFFLQGARLSRDAILNGMMHWRLHAASGAATFIVFPICGLGLIAAFPNLLPGPLYLGVLFLCALPSTVQSSIALTSIARGNIPAAAIGPILVPMLLYHPMQLLICAWIARRYATGEQRPTAAVSTGPPATNFAEPAGHRETRSGSLAVLATVIAPAGKP